MTELTTTYKKYKMSIISDVVKSDIIDNIQKINPFFANNNIRLSHSDIDLIQNFQTMLATEEVERGKSFRFNRLCTFTNIQRSVEENKELNSEFSDLTHEERVLAKREVRRNRTIAKREGRFYRINIKKVNHHLFSYGVC